MEKVDTPPSYVKHKKGIKANKTPEELKAMHLRDAQGWWRQAKFNAAYEDVTFEIAKMKEHLVAAEATLKDLEKEVEITRELINEMLVKGKASAAQGKERPRVNIYNSPDFKPNNTDLLS